MYPRSPTSGSITPFGRAEGSQGGHRRAGSPAGCTIAGLLALEDGRIRSVVARGIERATQVAAGLG